MTTSVKDDRNIEQIREVLQFACDGLAGCEPAELEEELQAHWTAGLTSTDLENILMQLAVEKISVQRPDWTFVAARLLCHSLYREAGQSRGYQHIGYGDFYQLLVTLTDIGRYGTYMLDAYTAAEIAELQAYIKPERDLLFNYIGLRHWSDRYTIRGLNHEVMELPQEAYMGIAMHLALVETDKIGYAKKFYDVLSLHLMTSATPTLGNARTPYPQMSSCFIDTPEDSLRGIYNGLKAFADVSKNAGGMGVYFGKLRATNSEIRGHKNAGGGVIPWARLYNDTAVAVNQLGRRAGSVSIWLDVFHKDIVDWLDLKTNNGDERRKAHDVFTGVCIPDLFYRTLLAEGTWHLFDPHEIKLRKGWSLEDSWGEEFEAKYAECAADEAISRTEIPALELMILIMTSAYETGVPFVFHRDHANRMNPNKHKGMVYCSNLCVEIIQNMTPTTEVEEVSAEGEYLIKYKSGDFVVCNLSSTNLGRTNTFELIDEVVPLQIRMMDNVITLNQLPLSQAAITNKRYRAVGLGTSGYHHHLVQKGIRWESQEHLDYVDELYEYINFTAIKASMELAKEKGAYEYFAGSDWQTGEYFELRGYRTAERGPDWDWLREEVRKHGLRNGYLMAIAPTGSTSVLVGTTASIDPIFKRVFAEEKKGLLVRQVAPELNARTMFLYKEAHHIDQRYSILAAGVRQRHLDQSQSLNLYATADLDEQKFLEMYLLAWEQGVKTLYYFRNFDADAEEDCAACSS
ncbi:ribonucleoside-diphosphate reductase subunit alpha [Tumebacillus lipolyticus]|uniref:Ribonucleoside-diphosphate reductase n=1 Tax=Tumebacillus lipolyticus TaxID=1280370 RepID=A0ABW4ZXE9_9BACL